MSLKQLLLPSLVSTGLALAFALPQTTTVPTVVQLPGTQPNESSPIDSPSQCLSCHAGYDPHNEPGLGWYGSMMAHSARDPLFWAALAVAENGFPGSGDLCIRCHVPTGWLDGRSTPTDGSALTAADAEGVSCSLCHQMVDPSGNEHAGFQTAPFEAHDGMVVTTGWYGSGEMVIGTNVTTKYGPYDTTPAPHSTTGSNFHRDANMCTTCHDVSNPVTGDLAPNNGAHTPLPPGTFDGTPGGVVDNKAAFNHAPYAFGVVERTGSEHAASALSTLPVNQYGSLPAELQAGALKNAYDAAIASTPDGNYVDGDLRTFSCQSCHMPPVQAKGSSLGFAPLRDDLPRHHLNGANTWAPEAIQWMDDQGTLMMGGGLVPEIRQAMDDGVLRSREMLRSSANLEVAGNTLKVYNLTGHKLPTGYPEGRRMWLEATWLDGEGNVLRVDGEYGSKAVTYQGQPLTVETILDLDDPHLRRWDAHLGITQDWAAKLVTLGSDPNLALKYDSATGAVLNTLGDLANMPAGSELESFHFVLNNKVLSDTRIPPYGMDRDEAFERNCQPIPDTQYGAPASGEVYDHFDEVALSPPAGAASAQLRILYQTTSWEYVQFLALADPQQSAFLGNPGQDLLDAWLATGMSAPEEIDAITWTATPGDCDNDGQPDSAQIAANPAADLDLNGELDVCQWLSADVAQISVGAGGTQSLALHAGTGHGGDLYLVLGTASGTAPGTPSGGVVVPLNLDSYLLYTLTGPNQGPLVSTFGLLDAAGGGSAAIAIPAGTGSNLAGALFNHAFVTIDPATLAVSGASNPVSLTLTF